MIHKRAADHEEDQDGGEGQRQEVLARRRLQVEVQEIAQVHHDLDDREDRDHDQGRERRQQARRHQPERDPGQQQGQHEALEVGLLQACSAGVG